MLLKRADQHNADATIRVGTKNGAKGALRHLDVVEWILFSKRVADEQNQVIQLLSWLREIVSFDDQLDAVRRQFRHFPGTEHFPNRVPKDGPSPLVQIQLVRQGCQCGARCVEQATCTTLDT